MFENIAERITEVKEKRNIIAIIGPPESGKKTLCSFIYNRFNQKFVMVSTTHYLAMEYARMVITKEGKDPDEYWEDTFMICQNAMWFPGQYEPVISELEFELNKENEYGIIGQLLKDTDYKYNVIESVKDPKELNILNQHNTLYISIFRENCEFDFPLFLIPSKSMITVNNNGTLEELLKEFNNIIVPTIKEKFNL